MAAIHLIAMTGSSGLIGKAFIARLSPDIKIVHVINSSKIEIKNIKDEVKQAVDLGAKYFLNLGWPASSYPENYQNSFSNFNALEKTLVYRRACEMFNMDFIGIGSVVDETPTAKNLYSLTKYVARQIFSDAILSGNITWLRPFYVFDASTWPAYLHNTAGQKVLIYDDAPRDFIHIYDVTEGIESVIRLGIKGEHDLGSQILSRPSQLCKIMKKEYQIISNYSSEKSFEISKTNETLSKVWGAKHTLHFYQS